MPLEGIWLPDTAREKPRPRFQCRICNHRFETNVAYEQHVIRCSREHEQELHEALTEWTTHPAYAPIDPEWETYNEGLRQQGLDPMVQYRRPKKSVKRIRES